MASQLRRWAVSSFALASLFSSTNAANLNTYSDCFASTQNLQNINGVDFIKFTPSQVWANFNLSGSSDNNLTITVIGNFSGNFEGNASLPSLSGDPSYWSNPNETSGKIVDQGPDDLNTTLLPQYSVASYQVQGGDKLDFCRYTNQSCPLSPAPPNGPLLSFTVSQPMYSNWALATIDAKFRVRSGNGAGNPFIACVSVQATPYLGDAPANLLRYLPVGVLLLTFVATASAAFSPWGTFNVHHWSSNYGRDEDQLRLITPGFGDCLAYIQFIVLSGCLALNYPGYYQPTISQVSWSTLMFNQSFWSHGPGINPVVDGIYALNDTGSNSGSYNGITQVRQLVGMQSDSDIWPGVMVWLLVVIAAVLVIIQVVYILKLLYRFATRTQEEDRRAKNWSFSVGNVIRIVFNYFLLPLITFCIYQIALAAKQTPDYLVALAVVTLVILLAFSAWLLYQILSTHPRSYLFDDLPTLLLYGPLYNTYSDAAAPFALVPMLVNLLRGIAIGAIQTSGIAQIVVLALAEMIYIIALTAWRPFSSPTNMNLYHTAFGGVRVVVIMLMLAFTKEVNAPYSNKVWVGYVILFLHGLVLFFGFFIHSLQTIVEVTARSLGAGGEGTSIQRGGLVKVFGHRQLSRRNPRRSGRARGSMASEAAMLDQHPEQESQSVGHSGMRSRSLSASSAFLLNSRMAGSARQSLAMDTLSQGQVIDASASSMGQSHTPGTPNGAPSLLSYTPGASQAGFDQGRRTSGMTIMTGAVPGQKPAEPADPYYRPPRARRTTNEALGSPATHGRGSAASGDWTKRGSGGQTPASDEYEALDTGADSGAPSPAYLGYHRGRADSAAAEDPDAPKPDYATREVDYYYGVRGPALNDQTTRKLKTGPADPVGPAASASGWFQKVFGGKTKDKHKGFEVVRGKGVRQGMEPVPTEEVETSREVSEPYRDDPGNSVPAARQAPRKLDLEDETDAIGAGTRILPGEEKRATSPLEELGIAKSPDEAPILPDIDAGSSIHVPSRFNSQVSRPGNSVRYRDDDVPALPRQASQKHVAGTFFSAKGKSSALSTIAQSPSPESSPGGIRRPHDAASAGGLSRMPFGSLGSSTTETTRPSIVQRAGSIISNISDDENRRPSFQSPPSPIEPPPQLIDTGDTSARRESSGSIGYVNQHRTSDNIVNPTGTTLFGGSSAELVDEARSPDRSPARTPNYQGAHINF